MPVVNRQHHGAVGQVGALAATKGHPVRQGDDVGAQLLQRVEVCVEALGAHGHAVHGGLAKAVVDQNGHGGDDAILLGCRAMGVARAPGGTNAHRQTRCGVTAVPKRVSCEAFILFARLGHSAPVCMRRIKEHRGI